LAGEEEVCLLGAEVEDLDQLLEQVLVGPGRLLFAATTRVRDTPALCNIDSIDHLPI
jgi:hypothetical protein